MASANTGKAKWLEPVSISSHPGLNAYSLEHTLRETPVQKNLRDKIEKHEKAIMSSPPDESQFLALLVQLVKAKNVIEVGVFMGYTTLTLAQALPSDGKVVALDVSEEFTNYGKEAWKEAGVDHKVDLRLAPGVESLDKLIAEGRAGTFDLAFIDADKVNYDHYYEKCLQLIRPGGVVAVDNVYWHGKVLQPADKFDEETKTIDTLNKKIKEDQRVFPIMIPIADGLTLAMKK